MRAREGEVRGQVLGTRVLRVKQQVLLIFQVFIDRHLLVLDSGRYGHLWRETRAQALMHGLLLLAIAHCRLSQIEVVHLKRRRLLLRRQLHHLSVRLCLCRLL